MSDEVGADVDTEQSPAESTQESADPTKVETSGKLIFGKYKTPEEAERGFKELERELGKKASELGDLRHRTQSLEEKSRLADVLERLGQPKEEAKKSIDFDAFFKEVESEITDNPVQAQRKMAAMYAGWMKETETSLKSEYEKRISTIESGLKQKLDMLEEETEKLKPDYMDNQDLIEMFTSKGMKLKDAKELAKQTKTKLGIKDERINPPSSISSTRSSSASATVERYLSDDDRAVYKANMGLSDAELDAMEADEQRRRKAERSR
jgi:hypothetical protein